jgi:hypothetical protein
MVSSKSKVDKTVLYSVQVKERVPHMGRTLYPGRPYQLRGDHVVALWDKLAEVKETA